MGIGRFFYF